jgi:hypothetical protein
MQLNNLHALASIVCHNARHFKWTVQGLGMLRMHITENIRLHIWHSSLRVPNVSDIHDHVQWGLKSTIISGLITNIRFRRQIPGATFKMPGSREYLSARIKAGMGGGMEKQLGREWLLEGEEEYYYPGDSYTQAAVEIHRSIAHDGTITFMEKTPTADVDGATVYWQHGDWVDAMPRAATTEEIERVTQCALALLTARNGTVK